MPWFIHWNDYRANFAAEASRILGHRVYVEGDAHATILPSPSLTFTNVKVDDENGNNLMTVGRFDVVIELMPLLQGQIKIVSMTLEKPVINVAVDAAGKIAWLSRVKLREPFDPDKVVLDNITIRDGALSYTDAQTGVQMSFDGISAQMSARALSGPWHIDGSYLDNGGRVQVRMSTGRVLEDGTIRVQANVIPARLPMTLSLDGPVGIDPAGGLNWQGTYSASQVAADDGSGNDDAANGPTGWRSEGTFALTADRLDISKAVLSNGPVDRPLSVAGTLTLNFGKSPSFAATAEARQIDLDRTLGKGPSQPVDVSAAADSLVAWLSRLPVPEIPGSIRLRVPTIVVGGRIIEDVAFTAAPAEGGWQIDSLNAKLPGQATVAASGLMTTQKKFGFVGEAHLAVAQPATFATWWRGNSQEGAGRLLAPFDLAGHADIGPGRVSFDHVVARIDNATITGHFGWGEDPRRSGERQFVTDLDADRVDFVQLKALAELLVGRNLADATALADTYAIRVSAGSFVFSDLTLSKVAIDASYAKNVLKVVKLSVDDIAGATIQKTSGEIDDLSDNPRGHLDVMVDAPKLTGLARLADRFLPASGFTRWLDAAAPALGEAVMTARITAPPPGGGNGFAFTVENGVAASTTFNLSARFTGGFAHWRDKPAEVKAALNSPDSAGFARQFGLAAVALAKDNGAYVEVQAKGVPATGLDTVVVTDLAGLVANARGKLTIGEDLAPSFDGTIGAKADNIGPIIAMAGLDVPGAANGTALAFDKGGLSVSGAGVHLTWKNGTLGPAIASGDVTLAPDGSGSWRIGGNMVSDRVDLGWIAALGLGSAPLPTGDAAEPWSRTPFAGPAYGRVSGTLQVKADRLDAGGLGITGTAFTLALQPQRIDLDLTAGQLAGGNVTGGMSIHNVDGNVNFSGRFDLKGASLESFVWRRDGRSVATGTLDLSAYFQSTGRSPAGLVSTMTGGGALGVRDGLARYVNPNAVRPIVRFSDLGQQYSEDTLRTAFGDSVEAGDLTFKNASGAFAIVAGAVQLRNLVVKTDGLAVSGGADIDLNTMTIDSDWTLSFDPVDNKVQGDEPRAGLVFRGPLAAPSRSLDVVQLAWYLNRREEARLEEILALDSATRAEKQRLSRLADKLQSDDAQRAEDLRIAAEREAARKAAAAAQAATLEAFHVNREALIEKRHVEALTALAERLAAQQKLTEARAGKAAQAAEAARSRADAAAKVLADARAADTDAAGKADAAAAVLAAAKAAADRAAKQAAQLADASDQASRVLGDARQAEADAKAAADRAAQAKADADTALQAASAKAAALVSGADKADALAQSTAADKAAADKAVTAAVAARDAAKADLAKAEAAVKAARDVVDAAASQATALGGGETAAETAKAKADAEAKTAADALSAVAAMRDGAAARLEAAKSDAAAARKSADDTASMAKMAAQAAQLAESLAGPGADADAIANAQAMQRAAAGAAQQVAAKQAAADAAAKAQVDAQTAFDSASMAVAEAEKRAAAASDAVTAAEALVKNAAANASRAATDSATAQADLDNATRMRDAAQATLAEKETAVEKTAAAAKAASGAAADAAEAAAKAQADAKAALAARADAEKTVTKLAAVADDTAKAAQEAATKRAAASADAKAAAAKATEAARASSAAAKSLAAGAAANEAAQAAAKAAARDLQAADAAAAKAAAQAQTADAAAQAASAEAADAADAAQAARQSAERAQQNAVSVGPIEIPAPALPKSGAAMAPGGATVAAEPVSTVPVAKPRPRNAPLPLVPSIIPTDRPLLITPPKY